MKERANVKENAGENRLRKMFRRKDQHHLEQQGGFMKDSMRIMLTVCVIIVVAFVWNFVIIQNRYKEETVQRRTDLFQEAVRQAETAEADIDRILMGAISNNVVVDYMYAEALSGRWDKLNEMEQFSANLTTLNDNIVAVCVYNNENEIIAMNGVKYTPVPETTWTDEYKFSNKITITNDSGTYFYAAVPVYGKTRTGVYNKVGGMALLLESDSVQQILDFAISGYQDSGVYFAVQDREGETIAAAGNQEIYENYQLSEKKEADYLYYEETLTLSEWKLIAINHKLSYMNYMNYVQGINLVTYIGVIIAQIMMCYMMYSRVIIPLKRQMNFVMNYTKDTSQRMETDDKYEFGELEKELNEMLDGIEELNRKILDERELNQKLEYEKKQTEIIAYKNQINPHFLHNTLECIRGMALYKGEREIAKLTEAMSRMFQYNIRGGEVVTVREMLRSIEDYSVIIEYRFMGKITMAVKAEKSVEDCMLPKMLIQPLVENAVRHGVQQRVEGGHVELEIVDLGEHLRIQVSDTGVGMDKATYERQLAKFRKGQETEHGEIPTKEIGVSNVARRLYLFYQETYDVTIESEVGKGTVFTLILPKKIPE